MPSDVEVSCGKSGELLDGRVARREELRGKEVAAFGDHVAMRLRDLANDPVGAQLRLDSRYTTGRAPRSASATAAAFTASLVFCTNFPKSRRRTPARWRNTCIPRGGTSGWSVPRNTRRSKPDRTLVTSAE